MKTQLEIGDKIQRFEVSLTKEIDFIDEITSVTKTLAKSKYRVYKKDLHFNTKHPIGCRNKIIAKVYLNKKITWSSPDFFLIEPIS